MRVAVVGGGPAGALVAALVGRISSRVDVFERENRVDASTPKGAGLLLQPAAVEILHHIGAATGIVEDGAVVTKLEGSNGSGWKVMNLEYSRLGEQFYGVGIQRHTLAYHLQKTLSGRDNVYVHYDTSVDNVEGVNCSFGIPDESKKQVHITDSNNNTHGPFDLVVVATGRNCNLREKSIMKGNLKKYPWGAYWSIVEMKEGTGVEPNYLQQFYRDTRKMLGFLPSGRIPGCEKQMVSVFWSVHHAARAQMEKDGISHWKNIVNRMAPSHNGMLDQITTMDDLIWAEYSDMTLKQLHCDNVPVVYVGDAGHAMSPQLGMGVTMACLDSYALYNSLRTSNTISKQLREFTNQRKSSLQFYHFFSKILTPLFQSNSGSVVGFARDIGLMVPNRLYWFDKQTAMTLSGYKTGLFTSSSPNFPTHLRSK